MRKPLHVLITLASVGLVCSAGAAYAQSCAPGKAGCAAGTSPSSTVRLQTLTTPVQPSVVLQPMQAPPPACTVPGNWVDAYGGAITILADLSGSIKLPYCDSAHALTITLQGTTGFDVNASWSGGPECIPFTETLTFQGCSTATGTFVNADGTSGVDTWTRTSVTQVGIATDAPKIPTASRVQSGRVLTHSNLTLTVTMDGQPAAGVAVALQSSRGTDDTITGPSNPTDSSGTTTAFVETRAQPGTSTITSATPDIQTASPGTIAWLPARYESSFLVTCYVVSLEADFVSTPLIGPVRGLPAANRYHRGFINDVAVQGSGIALDGSTIHYDGGGRYSLQSCPLTATGVCAADGTTVAVDRSVIPYRSTISIDSVGTRIAKDTGGAIIGYHIDEYFGTRRADCIAAGRRTLGVEFESY